MTSAKPKTASIATLPAARDRSPRTVREDAGMSILEMADLLGMSQQGYESWENGLRRPGGPARRLLRLIDNDVAAVRAVLT